MKQCEISISDVAVQDEYKCSRPLSDEFVRSVSNYGVLEPLLCMNDNGKAVLLCGHNRLTVIIRNNVSRVPVRITDGFDFDLYSGCIAKKTSDGIIAPAGILRALTVVSVMSPENLSEFSDFFCRGVSADLIIDSGIISDEIFFSFFNSKRAPFKLIERTAGLNTVHRDRLKNLIQKADLSLGSFRQLLEITDDIFRRDGILPLPDLSEENRKKAEQDIMDFYYRLRKPSYSVRAGDFEQLRKDAGRFGIELIPPSNFEGSYLDISFRIRSGCSGEYIDKKTSSIKDLFEQIVSFLE